MLMSTDRRNVFPDNPFACSFIPPRLPGESRGYRLWDFILSSGISEMRGKQDLSPVSPNDVKSKKAPEYVNTQWTQEVQSVFVQSHGFNEPLKSGFGRCVCDLPTQAAGKRWLDAAHVLTHKRCDRVLAHIKSCPMFRHGILHQQFCKAAAEIAIADMFDLPLDTSSEGLYVTMPYGIYVSATTSLGFNMQPPMARLPLISGMQYAMNKVLAVVCAVVQTGHDTLNILNPGSKANFRSDWWSYQPVRTLLAGWETSAWLAAQQVVYPERTTFHDSKRFIGEFAAHVEDLQSMATLPYLIIEGRKHVPASAYEHPGNPRFSKLSDWLESEDLAFWMDNTTALPCNTCMCVPWGMSPYGLAIPHANREDRKPKRAKDKLSKLTDWQVYWDKQKLAMLAVKNAKRLMYTGPLKYKNAMALRARHHSVRIKELKRKINERKKFY